MPLVARAQTVNEVLGVTVIEAEDYTTNSGTRSSHQWTTNTVVSGYSGTAYAQTTPNDGTNLNTGGFTSTSPELDYSVNFSSTGTHYVWVRGYATANTDDSVHAGIDGASSTASNMTLNSPLGDWQWTNSLFGSASPATISVGSTGLHSFNLWMREDGFICDRVILSTNASFAARVGNAWHIPSNAEPAATPTMRNSLTAIYATTTITLYTGNQYQGAGGDPGNQLQTGSTLYYRVYGQTAWQSLAMTFDSAAGNNKYYKVTIPANTFSAGDVVQYYFKIPYDDHLPTFLWGNDDFSSTTEIETVAQADPFTFQVQNSLTPSGPYLQIDDNGFEGRIYTNTGHVELAEPDLASNPLATVESYAPHIAKVNGHVYAIGQVTSSSSIASGIQLVQKIGYTTVGAKLSFLQSGVVRYEITDWNGQSPSEFTMTAASDSSEHFYGLGEKFNAFDQSNNVVHMQTFDQPGAKGDASYKCVPWFLSTRGYGFHLDSTNESWFDLHSTQSDRYTVRCLGTNLRCNIVGGPKLTDALTRYTGYSGRPPLPPTWVFGTWISSDIWHTGGEVRYAVQKFIDRGIPASVFVFDSPWETAYNDFNWNMTQFGSGGTYESVSYSGFTSVTQMMDNFRSNGMKVVCWLTPFINTSSNNEGVSGQNLGQSSNYATGSANNYFVRSSVGGSPLVVSWWKGSGSPVDFTNPAAASWFAGQLSTLVSQSEVATKFNIMQPVIGGFKTDDGETGNGTNTYIPTTAAYYDGRTGAEMENGYCVGYHQTVWNVLGTTGTIFSRSGFTGTQAFPAGWAGDNEPNFGQNGLLGVMPAAQSAAMCGYAIWASDIGGYQDTNFSSNPDDLFMRWTQFGAFSPIMQMHRQVGSNKQYPWSYSAAALANYVKYARLHTQLFPYIYTYAKLAAETGLPIIRPEVLLNQTDTNTYALQHSYYFGNELIAAPMNAVSSTSRNVYLPSGTWHDYWTNTNFTGGQAVTWSNADTSDFPLFVADGAIVPMLRDVPQTLCDADYVNNTATSTPQTALQVLMYPAATQSQFNMYDGTVLQCSTSAGTTTMTVSGASRDIELKFHVAQPAEVRVNNSVITQAGSTSAYDAASSAWRYDATTGFVFAKFTHAGGTSSIVAGPAVPIALSVLQIE